MTYSKYELELLSELESEEKSYSRYFLISFISKSAGRNRVRSPREIALIYDSHIGACHTLKEDWFLGADEVDYHLTGNDLIHSLYKYGYA